MRFIKVKTTFESLHKYNGSPESVKFLQGEHRHVFVVRAKIEVTDLNRELEFFIIKKDLDLLVKKYLKTAKKIDGVIPTVIEESCEAIAAFFLDYLEAKYKSRRIEVEVSEDDENSSLVSNYESFQ